MYAIDLGDGARLEPVEPWQATEFLAHMDRARETVDPWIPWAARSTDLASATATLQRYADGTAADTSRLYGIRLDGTLVGGLTLLHFDAANGTCEIGCWLEPAGRGRGLVTRAVTVLLDWLFDVRGIHRVEWQCRPDNVASANVARRLGMRLDGVLRGDFHYLGVHHDTQVWSLLAADRRPGAVAGSADVVP